MSEQSRSYDTPFPSWTIEELPPGRRDPSALPVQGLAIHNLLDGTTPAVAREIHIISREHENTEERAQQLRHLAYMAIREFGVDGESLDNAHYVMAEIIQNACRYSVSGPIWLSIVASMARPDIINITVANEVVEPPIVYPHDADDTHGRGDMIQDALALRHGRFDVETSERPLKVCVAYALMQCDIYPPSTHGDLTIAA